MKKGILLFFLICIFTKVYAQPEYILFKSGSWFKGWTWTLAHVEKPYKPNKWYCDKKNNTYYRIKSDYGIELHIHSSLANNACENPDYILFKGGWWDMRIMHVEKPDKLRKWYYDKKDNTYYRVKSFWGFGHPIKGAN